MASIEQINLRISKLKSFTILVLYIKSCFEYDFTNFVEMIKAKELQWITENTLFNSSESMSNTKKVNGMLRY